MKWGAARDTFEDDVYEMGEDDEALGADEPLWNTKHKSAMTITMAIWMLPKDTYEHDAVQYFDFETKHQHSRLPTV